MNRRRFIKLLLASSVAVPFLAELDIEKLKNNLDNFTDKELENIGKIKDITIHDYTPYFRVVDDDGDNVAQEYRVEMMDGNVFYYTDVRGLKNRFGDVLDYWKLPDIYSPSGRWYNDIKGEWL